MSIPSRVEPGESIQPIWMILLLALFVWMVAPSIYVNARPPAATTTAPATQPQLSPRETVIMNSIVPAMVAAALIAGNLVLRPRGLRRLGFSLRDLPRGLLLGIAGVFVVVPIMLLTGFFVQVIYYRIGFEHPDAHSLLLLMREQADTVVRVFGIVAAVVLAPLSEELLFRGHLQTAMRYTISRQDSAAARWSAIIFTTVIFVAVHEGAWQMPPIFVLSICLGYAYERTGNLWVPILIHAAFNTLNVVYFLKLAAD